MATLDEIFAAMPDAPAGGTHELLIIDPDTRQIEVPEIESIFGVIRDGNAEKKYFQCPRYVGKGIDLAACQLRIAYQNASNTEEGRDGYLVQDLTESGGYVYFSWELSEKVCLYQGPVQFAVCAMLGSAVVWNTTIAKGTVLEGLEYNGEIVQTEMQDVIAQLLALVEAQSAAVEAVGAAQVKDVQAAGAAAVVEINAAAANTATAIVCEAEGVAIQVADASDRLLQGLRIFGRSTQDGTPTPDNPVEIVSTPAPVVTVYGKNLLNIEEHFTFTGVLGFDVYLPAGKYILSFESETHDGEKPPVFRFYDNQNWVTFDGTQNANIINLSKPERKIYLYSNGTSSPNSAGVSASIEKLMLSKTGGEYEPYTGQTVAPANSLPGIPVASGGNYTDADGQQWICDEVDLGRGVYVQRVEIVTPTVWDDSTTNTGLARFGSVIYGKPCLPFVGLCNRYEHTGSDFGLKDGGFSTNAAGANGVVYITDTERFTSLDDVNAFIAENPLTFALAIATPIETPLSESELAAFAALHSNKPTTTILNDSGAHMAVEYVADTKLYIDSKLAELVAAMNA